MITNADITIYNRKYDKQTRLDKWNRTVVKGVSFYHDAKVSQGDKGFKKAEVYKIRIPADIENASDYLDEESYFNAIDVSDYWTLQNGDIIVKGICDQNIIKPSDLTKAHKEFCEILSWSDNRRGTLPHWRVGGV